MPNYCIKLTGANGHTRNSTLWVPGEWNPGGALDGVGGLCGPGFYHAYDTDVPALALFLNPTHAGFDKPRVWLAEYRGDRENDGAMKMGATEMRIVQELHIATPTAEQHVAFGIFAVLFSVAYVPATWIGWAEKWVSGEDRSRAAAADAYAAYAYAYAVDAYAYACAAACAAAAHAAYATYATYSAAADAAAVDAAAAAVHAAHAADAAAVKLR